MTGGGTLQENTGELSYCDIEIELRTKAIDKSTISDIILMLENLGAPKGSKLIIESTKEEIPFGKKEGLALYLDGQGLPEEVYRECDINFVISEIHRLTNIEPDADRNWQGEKEIALYFFNNSFVEMKSSISVIMRNILYVRVLELFRLHNDNLTCCQHELCRNLNESNN